MKVLFFGDYDSVYARNRVIVEGLLKNNQEVIQCNSRTEGIKKYVELYRKHKNLYNYDIIIIGYSNNRLMVPFAKLISKKPLIWDAFYSMYDNIILERKLAPKFGLKSIYHWFWDWLGCILADRILLDTNVHINYFAKIFHINKKKFLRVIVGSDSSIFYPRENKSISKNDEVLVHFHGKYIPLQGVFYIIKAIDLLRNKKNIFFRLIGTGQEYKKIKSLVNNLRLDNMILFPRIPYDELPNYIAKADICLGIFGDTGKTQRVIPNKVFEAMAMMKPVISAETPAMKEIFTNYENILFCRTANPKDLAHKIVQLVEDEKLRKKIACGAYDLFNKEATPKIICRKLIKDIEKIK